MESISLQNLRIVEDQLHQILDAIQKLELWNADLTDVNELVSSPEGMKTLAADCMLIEAIGEKELNASMNVLISFCFPHVLKYPGKLSKACVTILLMAILILIQISFGMS